MNSFRRALALLSPRASLCRSALFVFAVLPLFLPTALRAQRPTGGGSPTTSAPQRSAGSYPTAGETPVDLLVSVREPSGMPLAGNAFVKLISERGAIQTMPTQDNATATFPNLLAGEFDIEVTAVGYLTAKEHTSIYAGGTTNTVYVYLHSENESASGASAPGTPIMTPRLQGEIDKGLERMRKGQYDAARAQFEKAAKTAPGNPDIQYLLGMVEYGQNHFDAARAKFQSALSLNPSHERSLLALGELQLRSADPAGAAQTLEKAYQSNGADWRAHLLLATAYAQQKNYEQALPHAIRAAELGRDHAAPGWMLAGKIRMNEGKREEAKRDFAVVIRSFPQDPAVPEAKSLLAQLEKEPAAVPVSASSAGPSAVAPPVAATVAPPAPIVAVPPPAPARPWAPPDIDSKEYPAVENVACSEDDLVQHAQARMMRQLGNFERFLATEHIEHQEVDANGIPGAPREKDFSYLVFVEHPKPGRSFLEEKRDGGQDLSAFPTSLATQGLFALAVNVFSAEFQNDLNYKCEGLGSWRGQAAWRLRFEQKQNVPSGIRSWRNSRGTYPIPIKGRVWVNASSYDVLHIETDLREPVPEVQLTRDHLLIDYGPVKFDRGNTTLWLPWDAEMFLELRGKRYHHTHTLRNYMLFSVDTDNKISKPKETPEQPQQQK